VSADTFKPYEKHTLPFEYSMYEYESENYVRQAIEQIPHYTVNIWPGSSVKKAPKMGVYLERVPAYNPGCSANLTKEALLESMSDSNRGEILARTYSNFASVGLFGLLFSAITPVASG
jgi:hypothetical protein